MREGKEGNMASPLGTPSRNLRWHKPVIYGIVVLFIIIGGWSLPSELAQLYRAIMLNWR